MDLAVGKARNQVHRRRTSLDNELFRLEASVHSRMRLSEVKQKFPLVIGIGEPGELATDFLEAFLNRFGHS